MAISCREKGTAPPLCTVPSWGTAQQGPAIGQDWLLHHANMTPAGSLERVPWPALRWHLNHDWCSTAGHKSQPVHHSGKQENTTADERHQVRYCLKMPPQIHNIALSWKKSPGVDWWLLQIHIPSSLQDTASIRMQNGLTGLQADFCFCHCFNELASNVIFLLQSIDNFLAAHAQASKDNWAKGSFSARPYPVTAIFSELDTTYNLLVDQACTHRVKPWVVPRGEDLLPEEETPRRTSLLSTCKRRKPESRPEQSGNNITIMVRRSSCLKENVACTEGGTCHECEGYQQSTIGTEACMTQHAWQNTQIQQWRFSSKMSPYSLILAKLYKFI